jgi:hypothetical protein
MSVNFALEWHHWLYAKYLPCFAIYRVIHCPVHNRNNMIYGELLDTCVLPECTCDLESNLCSRVDCPGHPAVEN